MRSYVPSFFGLGAATQGLITGQPSSHCYHVKPFTIDLSDRVPHMLDLLYNAQLPDALPQSPGPEAGMDVATLRSLRDQWVNDFDWTKEQSALNT